MELDDLLEKFTEITELKAYASAQYTTILNLNDQLTSAKAEVAHLKEMLDASVPNIKKSALLAASPQEEACKREIYKLNQRSLTNPLTLEETKKLEIYTKLLLAIENKAKPTDESLKDLSDEELMSLVETIDGKASSK